MADSLVGCVKDIGKSIITPCLWPPIKHHIDYWWCFDDNIEGLSNEIRDLKRETFDINQKIEDGRLRNEKPKPGFEEWSKAVTDKLEEAGTILPVNNIPKAWNLISRYSMGKRAKTAAEEITKLRNDVNFYKVCVSAPPPAMGSTSYRHIMEFKSRKRIEEEIIASLKSSSVSMIGICGMGGVGKTTMVLSIMKRVKDEDLSCEVVMVVVSQKIDMHKIQEEIAELFGLNFNGINTMTARAHQLRTRLMDSRRKIIIFDDVWECLKFEDLGIPFESDSEKCKILLTSRSTGTCKGIKNKKVFKLNILEEEEAWNLFKEKAGQCVENSSLFLVAKNVAVECKGLPIALVTIGMALQDEMNVHTWKDALTQLKRCNPTDFPEVLADVYKPLELSYAYLNNERERYLFLLCCLFPEDHRIPVEQLTLCSVGLQMFDDTRSIEEARNRTHTLVQKLKSRFLLIDVDWDELHVKMHDVVRDVAIYIGSKEKDGFLKSLNNITIENSYDNKCNWMSVDIIPNEGMEVPVALHYPKLRLLMLPNRSFKKFPDISFEGIRDLNVLSFSYLSIESLPPTLGLLQNLRTLYMYSCTVENISVIGELTGLEILSCDECNDIKELPVEIGRLNRLRLLELRDCKSLKTIAFGIILSLVRLEELKIRRSFSKWETGGERRNAALTELGYGYLPNLSWLEIEIDDWNLAAQDVCLSPKLVKYYINIGFNEWYGAEERGYEKVMQLKLPGAIGNWIGALVRNAEYLKLEGDGTSNINLKECQNLRNLEIEKCSTLKKLVMKFPLLERLILHELENLEEMIWDGTIIVNQNVSLCNLKSIYISKCSKLRYLLSVSVARTSLLQLEDLVIRFCRAMEGVFWNEMRDGCIEFLKLKKLRLNRLPNLKAFCQGLENIIKFPNLTQMELVGYLRKLNSFCPLNSEAHHNDDTSFHLFCNQKVEIGGLKVLELSALGDNIRNIWCHQIPINFFNNLQNLGIYYFNGTRSLMSTSIAKNLVSLKALTIYRCKEMVEVIEGDDREVIDITRLFPTLKALSIEDLPKLRRFWQWNHALELPLLEEVEIIGCPVMETFTLESLQTPSIKRLTINNKEIDDNKDLNRAIRDWYDDVYNGLAELFMDPESSENEELLENDY